MPIPNQTIDLLVLNGTLLTMDSENTLFNNGAVAIGGEKILAVGHTNEFATLSASHVIDACGGIIMPGLVNTHTHLPMSLFRGLADDLPLNVWLDKYIFPAEKKYITPESVRYGTLLSCIEMLMSGITTCCDGYFYEDSIAKAVYDSGMRAVLGQGIIDFPAPGVPDPKNNINNAVAFAEKWQGACSSITPSIFCHSPYTCSAETLINAKNAAASKGLLFQIHAAETKNEWNRIISEHKATPIEFLDRLGILDQKTLLVHAIWVDDDDIERIAGSHASISHNPESNMKLASGIAPVPRFLQSNITVGLGTDGCASNNNLDLFQEMYFTAKLHKVNTHDPTVMDAQTVLKMGTIEGAKAIGLDKDIGSLETGKQADLIIINTDRPHLIPMYNPVSQLVYAAHGSDVTDVIIAGNIIVRKQKLLTLNVNEILERVTSMSKLIRNSSNYSPSNSTNANTL